MIFRLTAGLLLAGAPLAMAVNYIADDGTGTFNTGPAFDDVDFLWGNTFTTLPGAERITRIDVAFGNAIVGQPVELLLFDDPSDDLDPRDAVLLTSLSSTVTTSGGNTFSSFAITPTVVSGDFFIAALLRDIDGTFSAPIRQAPARRDASTADGSGWIFFDATGNLDLNNLSAAAVQWNVGHPTFAGGAANNMVRAVGQPVPEPAGMAVLLAAVLVNASRRSIRGH